MSERQDNLEGLQEQWTQTGRRFRQLAGQINLDEFANRNLSAIESNELLATFPPIISAVREMYKLHENIVDSLRREEAENRQNFAEERETSQKLTDEKLRLLQEKGSEMELRLQEAIATIQNLRSSTEQAEGSRKIAEELATRGLRDIREKNEGIKWGLEQKLSQLQIDTKRTTEATTQSISSLQNELREVEVASKRKDHLIESLNQKIGDIEEDSGKKDARIAELEEKLDAVRSDRDSLQQTFEPPRKRHRQKAVDSGFNDWHALINGLQKDLTNCEPKTTAQDHLTLEQIVENLVPVLLNKDAKPEFLEFLDCSNEDQWYCLEQLTLEGFKKALVPPDTRCPLQHRWCFQVKRQPRIQIEGSDEYGRVWCKMVEQ